MAIEELEVRATLRDELSGGLRSIRSELTSVTRSAGSGLSRAGALGGSALSKLGRVGKSALIGLGHAAKYGVIGAAGAIGILAKQSAGYASDLGESVNKTKVIFANQSKAVLDWSKSTADASGIAQGQALEAAAGFGNIANASGVAGDKAADMSKGLVNLAGDIASFNNIDPAEALEKLRAGLVGEAEPLRTVGVLLSETRVAQEAYRMGLAKQGTELTDAQKVQARYNLILKDTAKTQGDFARTASTSLPNTMRILKATFQDTLASLGQGLLPTLLELAKMVQETVAPALIKLAPVITALVKALGQSLGPILKSILPLIGGLGDLIADVIRVLGPIVSLIGQSLARSLEAVLPALKVFVNALGRALLDAVRELGPQLPQIAQAFADLLLALVPLIPPLSKLLTLFLKLAVGPAVKAVTFIAEKLTPAIEFVSDVITGLTEDWSGSWAAIKTAAGDAIDWILQKLDTLAGPLDEIIGGIAKVIGLGDSGLDKGVLTSLGGVGGALNTVGGAIGGKTRPTPPAPGTGTRDQPQVGPRTPRAMAAPPPATSSQGGGLVLNGPLIGNLTATADVDVERAAVRAYRRLKREAEERAGV